MAISDIINELEKASKSGKRNLLDQEGYDFLMSLGIDAFDYGFELVNDNFTSSEQIGKSYLIAAPDDGTLPDFENISGIKCEGRCGRVVLFKGRTVHPSIMIICRHCRDMIGKTN